MPHTEDFALEDDILFFGTGKSGRPVPLPIQKPFLFSKFSNFLKFSTTKKMASDLDLGVANLEPEQTWDDLPHFATAQHTKLFKQVQIQKQTLEKLRQEAGENQERISIMGEHLKNVKAEVSHTQVPSNCPETFLTIKCLFCFCLLNV